MIQWVVMGMGVLAGTAVAATDSSIIQLIPISSSANTCPIVGKNFGYNDEIESRSDPQFELPFPQFQETEYRGPYTCLCPEALPTGAQQFRVCMSLQSYRAAGNFGGVPVGETRVILAAGHEPTPASPRTTYFLTESAVVVLWNGTDTIYFKGDASGGTIDRISSGTLSGRFGSIVFARGWRTVGNIAESQGGITLFARGGVPNKDGTDLDECVRRVFFSTDDLASFVSRSVAVGRVPQCVSLSAGAKTEICVLAKAGETLATVVQRIVRSGAIVDVTEVGITFPRGVVGAPRLPAWPRAGSRPGAVPPCVPGADNIEDVVAEILFQANPQEQAYQIVVPSATVDAVHTKKTIVVGSWSYI